MSKQKSTKKSLRLKIKILMTTLLLLNAFVMFIGYELFFFENNFKIDEIKFVGDFNDFEKVEVYELVSSVKQIYLSNIRGITFSKDELKITESYRFLGKNQIRFVSILYQHDEEFSMRRVLCHEILHSLIYAKHEENIVRDIDTTEICYKND